MNTNDKFLHVLRAAHRLQVQNAPEKPRLRTPQCPPLPRVAEALRKGWTAEERQHVETCPYCRQLVARQQTPAETVLWGERGLVATLFLDLAADKTLQRWRDFLGHIRWGGSGPGLDWGAIIRVWAVVEPHFGSSGFGSPDLVALVELNDASTAVLLLEAKLGTYAETTIDPEGRRLKGYKSKLNGQLELNHRLALALAAYAGGARLEEAEWVRQTDYDTAGRLRYVLDSAVLKKLVAPLSGLPADRYLHVAITSDETNPFEAADLKRHRPEIFVDQTRQNAWESVRHRFGWLGWKPLRELAQWEPSLFAPTYALNEHYLQSESLGDDAPGTPADGTPWPANRPRRGVSVVFVPNLTEEARGTVLHFSWNGPQCALRNYLNPGSDTAPSHPRYRRTMEVLPLIDKERPFTRQRPRYQDQAAWRQIIEEINREWKLGSPSR
jgi:hypothetical protein